MIRIHLPIAHIESHLARIAMSELLAAFDRGVEPSKIEAEVLDRIVAAVDGAADPAIAAAAPKFGPLGTAIGEAIIAVDGPIVRVIAKAALDHVWAKLAGQGLVPAKPVPMLPAAAVEPITLAS